MSKGFSKDNFKKAAKLANIKEEEMDFRFSAFEAMSLAFEGKQKEAEHKLEEMRLLYSKLKKEAN